MDEFLYMSHWNYRVCKKTDNGEESYTIREVYYNEDNQICGVTEEYCGPFGNTVKDLEKDSELMQKAFKKKVVDMDTLELSNIKA